MLTHAQSPKAGIFTSVAGFVVLLFGASGVFTQLRKALNRTWNVQPRESGGWFDSCCSFRYWSRHSLQESGIGGFGLSPK